MMENDILTLAHDDGVQIDIEKGPKTFCLWVETRAPFQTDFQPGEWNGIGLLLSGATFSRTS
jgi:hypothetical protein